MDINCLYVKLFEIQKEVRILIQGGRLVKQEQEMFIFLIYFLNDKCTPSCAISLYNNDTQRAGSSADGIQCYLMVVKQNLHKHRAHQVEQGCSALAKQ